MLECISRTGQICAQYSDASPAWKSCPNIRVIFAHIQSAWNYQKRFMVNGERRRFLNQSMVVLLVFAHTNGTRFTHEKGFSLNFDTAGEPIGVH
jgi:hypothetical protein